MKRHVLQERRGAVRELRRDAAFLAQEADREWREEDAERDAERRRVRAMLEEDQRTFKQVAKAGLGRGGGGPKSLRRRKKK